MRAGIGSRPTLPRMLSVKTGAPRKARLFVALLAECLDLLKNS